MNRPNEYELMRWVCGELDESAARAVERAVAEDPVRAEMAARLRRTWDRLSEPPPESPGPDFTRDLLARLDERPSVVDPWRAAGAWGRLAAAAALAAGIALGVGLRAAPEAPDNVDLLEAPTLADDYLSALEALAGGVGIEEDQP